MTSHSYINDVGEFTPPHIIPTPIPPLPANMSIELSPSILLRIDAVPYSMSNDEGGVRVNGENDQQINPYIFKLKEWKRILEQHFTSNKPWMMPREDGKADPRFKCFVSPPPGMPRPEWLSSYMEHARKTRATFNGKHDMPWNVRQSMLMSLVKHFFERSGAKCTSVSLFRASIVLGLFLICPRNDKKGGEMTNMVLHLARSCPGSAPIATAKPKPLPSAGGVSHLATKSDIRRIRNDIMRLRRDLRKIVTNQETNFLISLNQSEQIARITQSRKGTRSSGGTEPDQEPNEQYQILQLSDDPASSSDIESDERYGRYGKRRGDNQRHGGPSKRQRRPDSEDRGFHDSEEEMEQEMEEEMEEDDDVDDHGDDDGDDEDVEEDVEEE